ncbi:MAG: nicotinamide riboside transporter PnuC [Burkholderiales bacterium]|nr:nicotinamide riboside transporter PnuC [Burkholderiales bacterium]
MSNISSIDILVFIISVAGILLEMIQNKWFWLSYIIGSLLLGYQFIIVHLYGSLLLQVFFIILAIYGWYKWTDEGQKHHKQQICHSTPKQNLIYVIVGIFLTLILYYLLKITGDKDYLIDSCLTAISLIATYMAALKQIESWFIFTATVFISVPLYYNYHLFFTCVAYIIFGILDFIGGIKWLREFNLHNKLLTDIH